MKNPVCEGIKQLRTFHNLTQTELADMAGVPRATLSNMEKENSNPSITVVVKIARALGVQVEDLITERSSAFVTDVKRKDMQVARQDEGNFICTRVSPKNVPHIQVNDINMLSGCSTRGNPHPDGSHEYFLCLEGTANLTIADEQFEVEAGNLIYFPGNLPHDYINNGIKPVHAISIVHIQKIENDN